MNSLLTIAVVVHNEAKQIDACLQSIFQQYFTTEFEILLIDNASRDGTVAHAANLAGQISSKGKMRIIRRNRNNLGEARAQAIAEARGNHVVFIDADCRPSDNWMQSLLKTREILAETSGVAGIGGPLIYRAQSTWFSRARAFLPRVALAHLGAEQIRNSTRLEEREHLPTANVIYLKSAVLAAGNFSNRFAKVCEDVDLSLRLKGLGFKLLFNPHIEVVHDQSEGWLNWFLRIFRYGVGQSLARGRDFWNWPLRLIFAIFALPVAVAFVAYGYLAIGLLTYVAVLFLSVVLSAAIQPRIWLPLLTLVFETHVAYGLGIWAGLIGPDRIWQKFGIIYRELGPSPRLVDRPAAF